MCVHARVWVGGHARATVNLHLREAGERLCIRCGRGTERAMYAKYFGSVENQTGPRWH